MKVFALVGPSGSGKSHRAGIVSHNYDIPLMIDDGLLIWDGKILAGKSAKRENTLLAAIRTALFYNPDHIQEVRKAIKYADQDKILILGTSVKMVNKIINTLGLPEISKIIKISSIASPEEIKLAQRIREKEGKHVIPVPTIEVKSHFPGYLLNPLELLFNKDNQPIKQEKTIVRPRFSFYGNLFVYNDVFIDLIKHLLNKEKAVIKAKNIKINEEKEGLKIWFNVVLKYGIKIPEYVHQLQNFLKDALENFTGVDVQAISIQISSLAVEK